jgi:hypothetical protein
MDSSRSCLEFEAGSGHELFNESLEVGLSLVRDVALSADSNWDVGSLGVNGLEVHFLEPRDLSGIDLIQVASDASVQNASLLFDGHGDVLLLLEELSELLSSVKELLGGSIEIGTELGESGDLTILGELELEGTGELLHGLDLGGRSDAGNGETNVDCGTDTLMEELGLEEDLTVGDGDHIGGNIGGHITGLGLNDGEGSEGSSTVGFVHLSCALEEARMEIENITGVGLTTRGSSEKQGHLSVGNSLFGQIVVDDQGVLAAITEELADGTSGVWGQELQGRCIGGRSSHHNGVLQAVSFFEQTHDV